MGVYGVLGLVLVMAVRIAALWQIAQLSHGDWIVMAASLIAAHASSRFAAVYLTRNMDYARARDERSRVAAFASPLRGMWLRIARMIIRVRCRGPGGEAQHEKTLRFGFRLLCMSAHSCENILFVLGCLL